MEPPPQLGGVGKAGAIVGIRVVLKLRAGLLRELNGIAEGVVVLAVSFAGHLAVDRAELHPREGRGIVIRHHANAAIRPPKTAEAEEQPLDVHPWQVVVALGVGIGQPQVEVGISTAE